MKEKDELRPPMPSFRGLQPASPASSLAKRGNRNRDTIHEILLRRTLWSLGLRFRKNVAWLPGKPDVVFPREKVVVFCDGDFWHGRNWPSLEAKLKCGANATYWPAKIRRNMERDRQNTQVLEQQGWVVIRLWETDIKRDPYAAALYVKDIVLSCRFSLPINKHANV